MFNIRKANGEDIKDLSRKLLSFLEDEKSRIYLNNIARFGIPDDYVRRAFAEETLERALKQGKAAFYLALKEEKSLDSRKRCKKMKKPQS